MNQISLSQACSPRETQPCLKVVFKEAATVLSLLSLSENLKASPLVEETAIYLSAFSCSKSSGFVHGEEHYIKVFLKQRVWREEVITFAETLIDNPLVKEVYFRIHRLTLSELIQFVCERLQAQRWVPFWRNKEERR